MAADNGRPSIKCVFFFFFFFFSHVSNGDADHGIHMYMSVQTSLNIVIKMC